MDSGALILVLCAVYLFAQVHLFKLDMFFAAAFFYLFVYCIFSVVGYVYFPQLSAAISAYFGKDIEGTAIIFLILSFLSVYAALLVATHYRTPRSSEIVVGRAKFHYTSVTILVVAAVIAAQISGLGAFREQLSYTNASDPEFLEGIGIGYKLWFTFFKLSPCVLTVLYAVWRYQIWTSPNARRILALLFMVELAVFLMIANTVGNRLELVALLNALLFVELIRRNGQQRRASGRFVFGVILVAVVSAIYMIWLSGARAVTHNPYEGLGLLEVLLYQDYYAPAHMLFAAISYGLTDLGEVLTSNFLNTLVLMNYPFLQQYVADVFNPGVSSRSTGYAFYVMSEGYLAFGRSGFLYNGLVLGLGLWLWKRIASTSNPTMNALILPILAMDLASLARGQSVSFVKLLYFHLVPALFFVFVSTGYYLSGFRLLRYRPVPTW